MVLMRKRKKLCRACTQRADCYIAHQDKCSQERLLSDPKQFCPASRRRW